jgi:hypothetical protein
MTRASGLGPQASGPRRRRAFVQVLVLEALIIAALLLFQRAFS